MYAGVVGKLLTGQRASTRLQGSMACAWRSSSAHGVCTAPWLLACSRTICSRHCRRSAAEHQRGGAGQRRLLVRVSILWKRHCKQGQGGKHGMPLGKRHLAPQGLYPLPAPLQVLVPTGTRRHRRTCGPAGVLQLQRQAQEIGAAVLGQGPGQRGVLQARRGGRLQLGNGAAEAAAVELSKSGKRGAVVPVVQAACRAHYGCCGQ